MDELGEGVADWLYRASSSFCLVGSAVWSDPVWVTLGVPATVVPPAFDYRARADETDQPTDFVGKSPGSKTLTKAVVLDGTTPAILSLDPALTLWPTPPAPPDLAKPCAPSPLPNPLPLPLPALASFLRLSNSSADVAASCGGRLSALGRADWEVLATGARVELLVEEGEWEKRQGERGQASRSGQGMVVKRLRLEGNMSGGWCEAWSEGWIEGSSLANGRWGARSRLSEPESDCPSSDVDQGRYVSPLVKHARALYNNWAVQGRRTCTPPGPIVPLGRDGSGRGCDPSLSLGAQQGPSLSSLLRCGAVLVGRLVSSAGRNEPVRGRRILSCYLSVVV